MAETLLSALCSEWTWEPNKWCTAKFNENGTGELYLRVEFSVFIAAIFEWKAQSDTDIKLESSVPATIDIEMTLTKRNMDVRNPPYKDALEDTAFQPKTHKLQLERRDEGFPVVGRTTYGHNPSYLYRLLWDKSPYPPLDEWKAAKNAAKGCHFWELNDFYRGELKAEDAS